MTRVPMSPHDWDDYRDRIWCWYMVEDKELLEVLEILREDGFDVKKGQLEYRLKGWKMSKNITLPEAKWMSSQIAIRNKDNKPTAFVRSGKLLSESQVKKAVDRHLLPTLKTKFITDTSSPPNPLPMDLLACSPGPAKFGEDFWQASNSGSYLPWIRFQVALLDRSIRINIMPGSRAQSFQAELLSGIIGATLFRIPAMKNAPVWLRDAADITKPVPIDIIILAAMYGYDKLLQKLIHNKDELNQSNQQSMWPLCAAAMGNKLSTCRYLLEKGADPNFKPPRCNTWSGPLHQAVYNNSEDLVRLFIEFGIDIEDPCALKDEQIFIGDLTYMRGTTSALTAATALRKENISLLLVLHNADISPLAFYMAVRNGHHDLVDMMLRTVLPVEVIDCRIATTFQSESDLEEIGRMSPFQAALENHDLKMCDILLRKSGVVLSHDMLPAAVSAGNLKLVLRILETQRLTEDDQYISEALDRALEDGHSEAAHILIRAGAEMDHSALIKAIGSCPVRSLQAFIETWEMSSFEKREEPLDISSILHKAFANTNNDVVEFALRKYPDAYSSGALCLAVIRAVRLSDFGEKTPLYDLLRRRREVDSLYIDPVLENTALALAAYWNVPEELLTSLLERPCPEALSFIPGDLLWTNRYVALCNAAPIDRLSMDMSQELEKDETCLWPVWRECVDWTVSPLFLAVKGRNYKAISKMIAQGYSPDENTVKAAITHITDSDMLELIICSCKYIHHGQEQQGLREGRFYPNKTVLQAAVEALRFQDDQRLIQQLLEAGADPIAPECFDEGYTALQLAAGAGKIAVAQQLIDFGADVNAPRAMEFGRTCLEYAAGMGRLDMVQYLLNAGAATDGKGKIQYIRSLRFALKNGHTAISQVLRQHRAWDDVDHSLFVDDGLIDRLNTILQPLEYTPEEIRELRSFCISNFRSSKLSNYSIFPSFWPEDPFAEQDRGNESVPDVTEVG
ncbi:hypothetical protein SCUP234_04793 [Seiridium cupressi]